jgi:hypothetical protein
LLLLTSSYERIAEFDLVDLDAESSIGLVDGFIAAGVAVRR